MIETRSQPIWTPLGAASHVRGVQFHINAHCFWVGCRKSSNSCDGQGPHWLLSIAVLSSYSSTCIVSLLHNNDKVLFFLQICSNAWRQLSNQSQAKGFNLRFPGNISNISSTEGQLEFVTIFKRMNYKKQGIVGLYFILTHGGHTWHFP